MMKIAPYILLLCLIGCAPIDVAPLPPPPPVIVQPVGEYIITQFDENGVKVMSWEVESYEERSFPNRVTFVYDGRVVTVEGSFQIDRKLR